MPSYNPNIPNGNTKLNQDYINIRDNFQQLNTTYGIDHVPLTDNSPLNGYHKAVHLVQQVAPGAVAGVGSLYTTTTSVINTDETLFYKSGANRIMQLTMNVQPVAAANGYSFLPGGILFQWGVVDAGVGFLPLLNHVDFITSNINFPTNIFGLQLTTSRAGNVSTVSINSAVPPTITGFDFILNTSTNVKKVYWTAIGN